MVFLRGFFLFFIFLIFLSFKDYQIPQQVNWGDEPLLRGKHTPSPWRRLEETGITGIRRNREFELLCFKLFALSGPQFSFL